MNASSLIALALAAVAHPLCGSEVFSTSFEVDELPAGYSAGTVIEGNKPYRGWNAMAKGRAEIIASEPGGPTAPDGQQFLRMHAGETVYLHHLIAPSGHNFTEPFTFSALARFHGTMASDGVVLQIAVTNWDKSTIYAGLQFGILHESGTFRFYWALPRDGSKTPDRITFGSEAKPDAIYRLGAHISPDQGSGVIKVYDQASGDLIAEAEHAMVYRGRPDAQAGFNFIRMHHNAEMEIDLDAIRSSLITP